MSSARHMRKPLAQWADALGRALSPRSGSHRGPGWIESVRVALADLIVGLRRHIAQAEGPRGLFAILKSPDRETVPTLDRRVEALRRQLTSLMDQAESLYLEVRAAASAGQTRESRAIVRDTKNFLQQLDKYREGETKLLMDSLNTVVGVGD